MGKTMSLLLQVHQNRNTNQAMKPKKINQSHPITLAPTVILTLAKKSKKKNKKVINNKKKKKKKTRGTKRKRKEDVMDEDAEYSPTAAAKKQKTDDLNVRRSTRNVGKQQIKYDDHTAYGDIEGLYDSDQADKENKKKEYKRVMKKRRRGGIKKLKSANNSNSKSPKSPKIKITNKNSPFKKEENDEDNEEEEGTSYTFSAWLDDIVSDTECQYMCRGHPKPAKINSVDYTFEVQTDIGAESYRIDEGKIKATDAAMEIVNADDNEKEWFRLAKIGDIVLCKMDDDNEEWKEHTISFINRRFDLQYAIRRSMNHVSIHEYHHDDHFPNAELRQKVSPPEHIIISETPEPMSQSSSASNSPSSKK